MKPKKIDVRPRVGRGDFKWMHKEGWFVAGFGPHSFTSFIRWLKFWWDL